jgi:hypothetical protein
VPLSVSRRTKNHVAYMADNLLTPCLVTQAMEDMATMMDMMADTARATAMADPARGTMAVITTEAATVRFSFMPPESVATGCALTPPR